MRGRWRTWVAVTAALLVFPGFAAARRDRPTNKLTSSLSGTVAVISRWTDDFVGNRPEFEREYVLPTRLHVPILDLLYDAAQPATVDLRLRSITERDRAATLCYRDLRAYIVSGRFEESTFHDRESSKPSHRREYAGDFYLRRFNQHPIHLYWDAVSLQGNGPYITRNHDVHRYGVNADLRTDFGRLSVEIPRFELSDRNRPLNDIDETAGRIGLHRAYRDYFLSFEYGLQRGRLPFFHEVYEFEELNVNGTAANVFGFHDLNCRLNLTYRNRPKEVVRNFHTKEYWVGDLCVTLTPLERSSVRLGVARKNVRTRRLNRFGINRLSSATIATIPQLEAVQGYEKNEALGAETYAKLFFNKFKKLSGHWRYGQTTVNQVPPTDVVAYGSTILLPHKLIDEEYRLGWTPSKRFGLNFSRDVERQQNLNRNMWTRSDYMDAYGYLSVWHHLLIGVDVSTWNHLVNQPLISAMLESVKSVAMNLTWDLRHGFEIFLEFREMTNKGARSAVEKIAESGVRFANGSAAGFDGRISVTFDKLEDFTQPVNDFRQASLNVAGTAKF
ncbi:MAG: hypothetical protein HY815_26065 [Candidatus Riflebacteria bacterium]|nr:hypothetical protein [Candidatus Riflebacteria bacterium]